MTFINVLKKFSTVFFISKFKLNLINVEIETNRVSEYLDLMNKMVIRPETNKTTSVQRLAVLSLLQKKLTVL